jgi:exopolysaccharide production protein ExoZ
MLDKKYNLIQILRGFAAIFVLLYHATRHYQEKNLVFLNNIFQNGYFGVDIFFVLSGFVIYYSSQKYLENNNYLEFLKKRIVRIYPSFWLFLLLPLTLVFLIAPNFIADKTAFETANYFKIFFLLFDHIQLSQISWTLSFEMYFYFLFFLMIFNKNFKYLIFIIIILAVLNLTNINLFENLYLQKYLISPLILEFFLGVAIVYILNKVDKNHVIGFAFLLILSIFFFIYIDYLSNNHIIVINKHNRVLNFGIASFLLILSLILIEKFNDIKTFKILIILGDSSYVLYLIHSVILSFLDNQLILSEKLLILNKEFSTILACLFIVVLSVIIHLIIEKPMLKYFNKFLFKNELT